MNIAERHAQKRAELLDATDAMLAEHGVDAFSWRGLARKMGCGPATLYEYFENKEELLRVVRARISGRLVRAVASAGDEPDPLRAAAQAYLEFAQKQPTLFGLIFAFDAGQPRFPQAVVRTFARAARRAIDAAALAPADDQDADTIALSVWTLVHGQVLLEQSYPEQLGGRGARALRNLLRGFGAP